MAGLDDLPCLLNPVQISDLRLLFSITVAERRPFVMMVWAGITLPRWAQAAGFETPTVYRWLYRHGMPAVRRGELPKKIHRSKPGETRLPLGAALRLAKVIGVPVEELFAGWT